MLHTNPEPNAWSKAGAVVGAAFGIPVKFALEVAGAAGAVWGASEVYHVRNEDNSAAWQYVAVTIGALALIRQAPLVYYTARNNPPSKPFWSGFFKAYAQPYTTLRTQFVPVSGESESFLPDAWSKAGAVAGATIGIPVKFALEVLGAAGAVWGASEVYGCRNEDNSAAWQYVAVTIGTLALIRQVPLAYFTARNNQSSNTFLSGFFRAYAQPYSTLHNQFCPVSGESESYLPEAWSKIGAIAGAHIGIPVIFSLEVLGAAGAVWGSSEVCGLRNEDNSAAWRSVAACVGAIAFFRQIPLACNSEHSNQSSETFWSSLFNTIAKPVVSLKNQFMPSVSGERQPLLSQVSP